MIYTREQLINELIKIIERNWRPWESYFLPIKCANEIADLIATLNDEYKEKDPAEMGIFP